MTIVLFIMSGPEGTGQETITIHECWIVLLALDTLICTGTATFWTMAIAWKAHLNIYEFLIWGMWNTDIQVISLITRVFAFSWLQYLIVAKEALVVCTKLTVSDFIIAEIGSSRWLVCEHIISIAIAKFDVEVIRQLITDDILAQRG